MKMEVTAVQLNIHFKREKYVYEKFKIDQDRRSKQLDDELRAMEKYNFKMYHEIDEAETLEEVNYFIYDLFSKGLKY